jgi:hypothetical protein
MTNGARQSTHLKELHHHGLEHAHARHLYGVQLVIQGRDEIHHLDAECGFQANVKTLETLQAKNKGSWYCSLWLRILLTVRTKSMCLNEGARRLHF